MNGCKPLYRSIVRRAHVACLPHRPSHWRSLTSIADVAVNRNAIESTALNCNTFVICANGVLPLDGWCVQISGKDVYLSITAKRSICVGVSKHSRCLLFMIRPFKYEISNEMDKSGKIMAELSHQKSNLHPTTATTAIREIATSTTTVDERPTMNNDETETKYEIATRAKTRNDNKKSFRRVYEIKQF